MGAAVLPFTAMLYFDIRSLEARAESVDAMLGEIRGVMAGGKPKLRAGGRQFASVSYNETGRR